MTHDGADGQVTGDTLATDGTDGTDSATDGGASY